MSGLADRHEVELPGAPSPATGLLSPEQDIADLQLPQTEEAPVIRPGRTLGKFISVELEAAKVQQSFMHSASQVDLESFKIASNLESILERMLGLPSVEDFISEDFQTDLRKALQLEASAMDIGASDAYIDNRVVPRILDFASRREIYDPKEGRLPEYFSAFLQNEIAASVIPEADQSELAAKKIALLEFLEEPKRRHEPAVLPPQIQEELLLGLDKAAALVLAVEKLGQREHTAVAACLRFALDVPLPHRQELEADESEYYYDTVERGQAQLEGKIAERENMPELEAALSLLEQAGTEDEGPILEGAITYLQLMLRRHARMETRHLESSFPIASYGSELPFWPNSRAGMSSIDCMALLKVIWKDQVQSRDAVQLAMRIVDIVSEHLDPQRMLKPGEQAGAAEMLGFIVSNWRKMQEPKRYQAMLLMAQYLNGELE